METRSSMFRVLVVHSLCLMAFSENISYVWKRFLKFGDHDISKIIGVHAPTDDADINKKQEFYDEMILARVKQMKGVAIMEGRNAVTGK